MDSQQAALEGWLRFNDEDVACNRDGRLSRRQRRQLLWSAAWRLVLGAVIAVLATLGVTLDFEPAIAVLFALVALCLGLYLMWRGFAFMVDATSGAVAFVTAPLRTRLTHGRSTSYFVDVGPVTRVIKARAYAAIRAGDTYHLFYAPGCRSLLSLEPESATEPLPAHAFGADSAHVWDRLRWSWILLTVGVFGALLGAHQVTAAHPAHPIRVAGTVQDYVEERTTGRGAHIIRSLYLVGDGTVYTPDDESAYAPPVPDYYELIGKSVVLYVDEGTADVIALSDGDTMYSADWYLHPDHETNYMLLNGVLTAAVGVGFLLLGFVLLLRDRRQAEEMPGRSGVYVPPTAHPLRAMWGAALVLGAVLAFIGLGVASAK